MYFRLTCSCGKDVFVNEGAAGSKQPCPCGLQVDVPGLAELRRQALAGEVAFSLHAEGTPPAQPAFHPRWAAALGCIGLAISLLGFAVFVGNVTGWFPTFSFAGFLLMALGGLILAFGYPAETE